MWEPNPKKLQFRYKWSISNKCKQFQLISKWVPVLKKSYTKKFEWVKSFFGNSIDFRMLFITKCFSHLSPRVQPLGPIWCYSTFYYIITRFAEGYSIMTHLFIQSPIKFRRRRVSAEDLMQINYHSTSLAWTYFAGTCFVGTSQSWLKWLLNIL